MQTVLSFEINTFDKIDKRFFEKNNFSPRFKRREKHRGRYSAEKPPEHQNPEVRTQFSQAENRRNSKLQDDGQSGDRLHI